MALRAKKKTGFLWVDAICINQSDTSDKNYQLPLMAQIYSKACNVICWLGEASVDSSLAISTLKMGGKYWRFPFEMACFNPASSLWGPIRNLIRRPYWTRVWIAQENHVAQQRVFMCGDEEIRADVISSVLNDLAFFLRCRKAIDGVPNATASHAAEAVRNFNFFSSYISHIAAASRQPGLCRAQLLLYLNNLMFETSRFLATDPRDRLYGLLGLLPREVYKMIRPNYGKSATAVFTHFALLLYVVRFETIAQSGIGHSQCQRDMTACLDMPSWVPSYQGTFIDEKLSSVLTRFRPSRYRAGGFRPPRWWLVPRTQILRVDGLRQDVVTVVSAPSAPVEVRLVNWSYSAAVKRTRAHPCGNWRQAFYRTLLLGRDRQTLINDTDRSQTEVEVVFEMNTSPLCNAHSNTSHRDTSYKSINSFLRMTPTCVHLERSANTGSRKTRMCKSMTCMMGKDCGQPLPKLMQT